MKLEDICVNLHIAKMLRDSGFPQEGSLFYWVHAPLGAMNMAIEDGYTLTQTPENREKIAAPIAEEILKRLSQTTIEYKSEKSHGLCIVVSAGIAHEGDKSLVDTLGRLYHAIHYFKNNKLTLNK